MTMEANWSSSRQTVNGVTLHVVEAGPADGPLLILLHGFPEFWWAWRHHITPLAEAGYHVIVPDMRGYNLSDTPKGLDAYRLETLSADVLSLADRIGVNRFSLVGHDWGGVIAWDVAASHPGRIDRLVVMDAPNADLWAKVMMRRPTQALRSTYAAFFQLPAVPEAVLRAGEFRALREMMQRSARKGTFPPEAMDRYVEAWSHPGSLTAMLNYYRALRKRRLPREPRRVRTPALILWGENDVALEHHVARAALEACDDGQLKIIPDTTHWLHLEEPDRITAEIMAFLATNP
jgi:pimeloyl-ACP methyl ester carboxylesterase